MTRQTLAHEIAARASALKWNHLAPARQEKAQWCMVDFLGNVAASAQLPDCEVALILTATGEISLFGFERSFDAPGAALVMGTAGALLQTHDVFQGGGNHPSSCVIPAAWVSAQEHDRSDVELLQALVAGYEVTNRLAAATYPHQQLRGSAPTGTAGAVGAATAAGLLAGLDPDQLAAAIGSAAFLAPLSSYQGLRDHGSAVPIHGGYAARTGIEAVRVAAAGFSAGGRILEGDAKSPGFLSFLGGSPEGLAEDEWNGETLDSITFKLIPACFSNHPILEAGLKLLAEGRVRADDIETVVVRAAAPMLRLVETGPGPELELYDRLMSLRWTLALLLQHGRYGVREVLSLRDSTTTKKLVSRIEIEPAADLAELFPQEMGVDLTVTLGSGECRRTNYRRSLNGPLVAAGSMKEVDCKRLRAKYVDFCHAGRVSDEVASYQLDRWITNFK